jgi:hypothetical protein
VGDTHTHTHTLSRERRWCRNYIILDHPSKRHTSLLLDQQGKFLAFGSKAREDYYEHDESGMLFENFKMRLHDDHRGSEPMAFALNGKTLSLLKVITHSLKSAKDDAMVQINLSQVVERERERERKRERERFYIPRHTYKRAHSKQKLILSSRVVRSKS